jgi:hypothetical protein
MSPFSTVIAPAGTDVVTSPVCSAVGMLTVIVVTSWYLNNGKMAEKYMRKPLKKEQKSTWQYQVIKTVT